MTDTKAQDDLSYLGSTAVESKPEPFPLARSNPPSKDGFQKFVVRLPNSLHAELGALAIETGCSMNEIVLCGTENLVLETRVNGIDKLVLNLVGRRAERRKAK